jgi:hypothetical protein
MEALHDQRLADESLGTTRSSTSRSWLFSALAIALCRHLRTSVEIRLRENSRSASAVETFLPRMSWARRFSFCGLTRRCAPPPWPRSRAAHGGRRAYPWLTSSSPSCRQRGRNRCASARTRRTCGPPSPRRRSPDMLVAVVDAERETDELREDRGATAPDLDDFDRLAERATSAFFSRYPSTNGPFQSERAMTDLSSSSCGRDGSTR